MKLFKVLIPIFIGGIVACNSNKTSSGEAADSTATDSSSQTAETSASLSADDQKFVTEALGGGMLEVELGKIAQKNASSDRVKKFGEMMVTDHTKAGEELKALATAKNIQLPADPLAEHKEHLASLSSKTGVDFDKAYLKMMLKDHRGDIKKFEDAAKGSQDADLKALAQKTLPVLNKHLDSAKAINKVVKASLDPNDLSDGVETFPQR